jgi:hypothetical protein
VPKGPIPVGFSKVEAVGALGPATWANVFYVDTTPSDPSHPADAMAAAAHAIHQLYADLNTASAFPSVWSVARQRVTYRADPTSTYSATIADGMAGTSSAALQDAQVSFLLNWVSGDARKGGKPRQYLCGVPTSAMQDSARLTSSWISSWNGALATWFAAFPYIVATGHAQGIVEMSFVLDKVDRAEGFPIGIVAGTVNPVVATQRRRVDRLRN